MESGVKAAGMGPFKIDDPTPDRKAAAWRKYMRRFELYLFSRGEDQVLSKKISHLLWVGGDEVIEAYELSGLPTPSAISTAENATLAENAVRTLPTTWEDILAALTKYFEPTKSKRAARRKFRTINPNPGESMDQFATRLKTEAVGCEYDDLEEEIFQQIIQVTENKRLLAEIFKKDDMKLSEFLQLARIEESMRQQVNPVEQVATGELAQVNSNPKHGKTASRNRPQPKENSKNKECLFCGGSYPHPGGRTTCPASGKTCGYCSLTGHFEAKCLKKKQGSGQKRVARHLHARVEEPNNHEEEGAYLFRIYGEEKSCSLYQELKVNGVPITFLLDTGAEVNVLASKEVSQINTEIVTSRTAIHAVGARRLSNMGQFDADVQFGNKTTRATFH